MYCYGYIASGKFSMKYLRKFGESKLRITEVFLLLLNPIEKVIVA